MATIRRIYIYLVSAISLQALTWAVIALLRNLFIRPKGANPAAVAFQIAVILVSIGVFLVHWLWSERLAGKDEEERSATLRRLYLFGTLAGFLAPFVANAFSMFTYLFGVRPPTYSEFARLGQGSTIVYHLLALVVLAPLWFYHQRVLARDTRGIPIEGAAATIQRLYLIGFSTFGLVMTSVAIIHTVRWISFQFGGPVIQSPGIMHTLGAEMARFLVGVPLWLVFWLWAQRLFKGPSQEELESALRKLYLYAAVFAGALGVVGNATIILASVFRRLLDRPSQGDIRTPLANIVGLAFVWAYHAYVLRADTARIADAPRQAGIRRLYLYLIAAIGLAAVLVGLGGDISVLLRTLNWPGFIGELREQLAWFTAALISGLPVWLIPWREVQNRASEAPPAGEPERRSLVRKIYLYFFLFLATMTVLASAVFIFFRLIGALLGEDPPTLSELGQAIAFMLMAIGVLVFHGLALRGDGRLSRQAESARLAELQVTILDFGPGLQARLMAEALQHELPGLNVTQLTLPTPGEAEPAAEPGQAAATEERSLGEAGQAAATAEESLGEAQEVNLLPLSQANLIVAPWTAVLPGAQPASKLAQAIAESPARKLLLPTFTPGWDWAGVDRWNEAALLRQVVHAVKQIAAGEEVRPHRPLGIGAIIGIVIGVILLLLIFVMPLISFFMNAAGMRM